MRATEVVAVLRRQKRKAKIAMLTEVVMDDPEWLAQDRRYRSWLMNSERREQEPAPPRPTGPVTRRIDALWISGPQRTAFEIKVERGDWRRETEAKREPWAAVCHRFIYVCPDELIMPEEVPPGCGLWWVNPHDFTVTIKVRAKITKKPQDLPKQVVIAMAFRAERAERR